MHAAARADLAFGADPSEVYVRLMEEAADAAAEHFPRDAAARYACLGWYARHALEWMDTPTADEDRISQGRARPSEET